MSRPLGCRSAGKSLSKEMLSGHPAWTAHVIEESIQVSMTSFSPSNSVEPHFGHLQSLGFSDLGSTGSQSRLATRVSPHFLQIHAGIGVPNILCLEITQSQSSDVAQS